MANKSLCGTKEQLANIAKLISEAQTLDANGDELGAYRHYLSCVAQMTQALSNDIQANQGQGTLPQQQCVQLFKMARHCLERGEEIYTTAKCEQRPLALFRLASPSPTASPTQTLPPLVGNSVSAGAPPDQGRIAGIPPIRANSWPVNPGPPKKGVVNVRAVGVGREDSVDGSIPEVGVAKEGQSQGTIRHLSYMEKAKLRNQHMMEQYKAYLRETRTSSHLPSDAGLSMLRRLEENVSVARIREQTIARKLREREMRIQQEARTKRHVSLSSLSVDELCDHVTSYEHSKCATSVMSSIKARLNTAGTNFEQTYSIVSEILSLSDHPLTKLLGEGQYSVYMMLQPVVLAVEKAGGLPRLEIRLDNCGLDRKPSVDILDQSNTSPDKTSRLGNHDDDLLDLLADDDDDDDLLDSMTFDTNEEATKKEQKSPSKYSPLYHILERQETGNETERSNQPNVYESFHFDSNAAYGSLGNPEVTYESNGEPRYISHSLLMRNHVIPNDPTYANTSETDNERSDNFYDVPRPLSPEGEQDTSLYDQIRAVHIGSDQEEVDENNDQSHIYEPMDSVFTEESKDSPDGAAFSRPPPPPKEMELTEVVTFKNLPPLMCAAQLGDEASLVKLSDTAASVIKEAVKNIQNLLNTLEDVFAKCYPVLNSEDNREVCSTVLEANFFPPILQPLTLAYRCKNYKEECLTAKNMCQHVNDTPKDLSVRKKFWLIEQTYAPYGEAIDELRRLPSQQGPTPKLDGLVKMSKLIVKCIDDHYEAKGRAKGTVDTGVGVDDILPILSYIIIRSGLPQLVSECSIMEEFIRDGYMRGEEGFCLTSFLTALKFISHMSS